MATSGPVKNKDGYTISVDRDLCVTLAVCIGLAHKTFELDAEGKAVIKDDGNGDTIENLVEAAKGCPVNAIIINHPNGKRIWPDPEVDTAGNPV
ncbi:MAG: ferredoxin [Patescibacteria group bacterium]